MNARRYALPALIIIILLALVGYLVCRGCWPDGRAASKWVFVEPPDQLSLEQFITIAKERPMRAEIFYVLYSTQTFLLSEQDVVSQPHVAITCDWASACSSHIADVLDDLQPELGTLPVNFRYCCAIHSLQGKTVRFSMGWPHEVLYVNGKPYRVPFETVTALLKLLPAPDYELAVKELRVDKKSDSM